MSQTYEPLTTTREERGEEIAKQEGQIKRMSDYLYKVKSQSGNNVYTVKNTEIGWKCSCPDHQTRGLECKLTEPLFSAKYLSSHRDILFYGSNKSYPN